MSKKGKLYLIPTILGENTQLSHIIPPYVKEIVNTIDHYIVENEKSARHYLKKLEIQKPIQELKLYPLNRQTTAKEYSEYLKPASEGYNIGVISEAGCPGIADPGAEIVSLAHKNKIQVVPLTGPSSLLLALMASGLNGQSFAFHGYLPIDKKDKAKKMKDLERISKQFNQTQLFIETPYRNQKMLEDLIETLHPDTLLCVATDITLPSEEIYTLPVWQWKKKQINLQKRPAVFLFLYSEKFEV
jgi:16S rRNA (cytidine1402-2'-O)-methyltransferase